MEQIIVIILFYQDHLLHKNREERGKGTWPRIGMEHYPTGDIYLLASCSACEILTGWEPASHRSAHGLLRQRLGVLLLLWGPFYLPACLSCAQWTHLCTCMHAHTYTVGHTWGQTLNTALIGGPSITFDSAAASLRNLLSLHPEGVGDLSFAPVTRSFLSALSLCSDLGQSLELGDPWGEPWAWKTQSMASCFCHPASSSSTRPQPSR